MYPGKLDGWEHESASLLCQDLVARMQEHQALELTGIRVCALIVSRQIGLLDTRVGEAAAPGLDGGGDGILTTINSRKQRMKAVDRIAGKNPSQTKRGI